jgi:hypothetical protein
MTQLQQLALLPRCTEAFIGSPRLNGFTTSYPTLTRRVGARSWWKKKRQSVAGGHHGLDEISKR